MIVVTGRTGVNGANGVIPNVNGQLGLYGDTALCTATASNTGFYMQITGAEAIGGFGGSGGGGANAGYDANNVYWGPGAAGASHSGGNAYANAIATTTNTAEAIALGGVAGNSGVPGLNMDGSYGGVGNKGGVGGLAAATSVNYNSLAFATATSTAIAGDGGASYGAGNTGGGGGVVFNSLSRSTAAAGESVAGEAATATVSQTAGSGGAGLDGAKGGAGAASTATNAVTGYANGGVLTLSQTAVGGAGGSSDTAAGGKGGAAISSLTFDDTQSVTQSATVNGTVAAVGGAGATGATIAAAAAGTATLVVTGAGVVNAATAATGGAGVTVSGVGTATTTATGVSGTISATENASLFSGQLVQSVSAATSGAVDGTSVDKAYAAIAGASKAATGQGVAYVEGAPLAASISAVLTKNASINTAFGASPVFFGIAELGGAYSAGGKTTQTITSSFSETVDLTQLATPEDLVAGFYSGKATGAGFSGMTFDLYADGVDVVHETFSSAKAATTFFTNNAIDLGSLASGPLSGSTLNLRATMSITASAAGSGFSGSIIVGDPPTASGASAQGFVQAMAGMIGGASAVASSASAAASPAKIMLATPAG